MIAAATAHRKATPCEVLDRGSLSLEAAAEVMAGSSTAVRQRSGLTPTCDVGWQPKWCESSRAQRRFGQPSGSRGHNGTCALSPWASGTCFPGRSVGTNLPPDFDDHGQLLRIAPGFRHASARSRTAGLFADIPGPSSELRGRGSSRAFSRAHSRNHYCPIWSSRRKPPKHSPGGRCRVVSSRMTKSWPTPAFAVEAQARRMRVINDGRPYGQEVMYASHHDELTRCSNITTPSSSRRHLRDGEHQCVGYMGGLALRRDVSFHHVTATDGHDDTARNGRGSRPAEIWRLACGPSPLNGLGNKFWESDDSVVASAQAIRQPLFGGLAIMPVIGSGQWAGQAPQTLERVGTQDLIYLAGGGIFGHPGGAAAGVASIRQAWEAAANNIPLETSALTHSELREALIRFGRLREQETTWMR